MSYGAIGYEPGFVILVHNTHVVMIQREMSRSRAYVTLSTTRSRHRDSERYAHSSSSCYHSKYRHGR